MSIGQEPAFPCLDSSGAGLSLRFSGMDIRTYAAIQIAAGIAGDGIPGPHHAPDQLATEAVATTDALLAALSSKPLPSVAHSRRDEVLSILKRWRSIGELAPSSLLIDDTDRLIAKIEGGAS